MQWLKDENWFAAVMKGLGKNLGDRNRKKGPIPRCGDRGLAMILQLEF
jgi:hypothetical protein